MFFFSLFIYFLLIKLFILGKKSSLYQKDSPDWVPTKHMSSQARLRVDVQSPATNDRYQRKVQRHKKTEAAAALMELSFPELSNLPYMEPETGISCQTDIDQPLYMAMEEDLQNLRTENIELQEEVLIRSNVHSMEVFKDNDERVKYYTGLPTFSVMMALFNLVEKALPKKQSVDKFQFLTMCLMRMRLNLPLQFLAYEFAISLSSASRYFAEAVNILYVKLGPLIQWPERETLRKTMPMQFLQNFGNKVAVIIDCFEIFTEQPSNLLTRTKMWSQYKHHHTVKYLIGISPQGKIIYISKGWGGRTSDKYITEHSDFLSHIYPGDIVMADRGFDIGDTLGCLGAVAKIPAFTKGRNQLSALDIESTRKLASCRIHVERVIGLVRQKYTMLSSTLSLDMLARKNNENCIMLDKIVYVACCLANLCPSVVDFN